MEKSKTLISIDGGMSTGISVGTYSDTEPYRLTHSFQIGGGVEGFLSQTTFRIDEDEGVDFVNLRDVRITPNHMCPENTTLIAEKFTARGGGQGFALRTEHLEPLRIEGAMLAMGLNPHWVSPPQQYFAGGKSKPEKKKAQHKWLKEHDLYVTGKMVDAPDADDVRSSIAHAIAFLVRERHIPTMKHYFKEH